ncbi:MAG: GlsB/YeaQ/YmgE family stress response membrane protein [Parvibaculaceae bacterium]
MEAQGLMDLGGGVGWIGTLFIGGLAGWIAEKLTKSDMGIFMNIIVGIIGAYIGAFLANALGLRLGEVFQGWFWGNLLVAVIGAVILLLIVRVFRGRSA